MDALGPCSYYLRVVPSVLPENRLHLQAFFRNRAARLKIPGLNHMALSTIARTHCSIVKRVAQASAFAETRATFA